MKLLLEGSLIGGWPRPSLPSSQELAGLGAEELRVQDWSFRGFLGFRSRMSRATPELIILLGQSDQLDSSELTSS